MARPEHEIEEELDRLDCEVYDRQLPCIAQALSADDTIVDAVGGKDYYSKSHVVLILTQRQILGVTQNLSRFAKGQVIEVQRLYWRDVANIEVSNPNNPEPHLTVLGYGNAGGVGGRFDRGAVPLDRFAKFADKAQQLMAAAKAAPSSSRSASRASQGNLLDQLERLAALREKGHISKDEFEQAKRKLLA